MSDRIREVYAIQRAIMDEQRAWVEHVHATLPPALARAVLMGLPLPRLADARGSSSKPPDVDRAPVDE